MESHMTSPLSDPIARPALLVGGMALVLCAMVAGMLPSLGAWSVIHWLMVLAALAIAMLVSDPRPGLLPWPREVLIGAVTASAIAVTIVPQGRAQLGEAGGFLLGLLCAAVSMLIVRGHYLVGTLASLAVLAAHVGLGAAAACSVVRPFGCAPSLLLPISAGWVLFVIERAISRNRAPKLAEQFDAAVRTDSVQSQRSRQQRATREIPLLTAPILHRIAEGEPLTAEFHSEVRAVDEQVRSLLRPDVPTHAGFVGAVADAQRRGVIVRIVGSEDERTQELSEPLAARMIELLGDNSITRATIRFVPRSRGGTTAILLEGAGGTRRLDFDADGTLTAETD